MSDPLLNDAFYALAPSSPLDLTPMVLMRFCPMCRQPELCYADKVDSKHGVSLKSFGRGHQLWDLEAVTHFDDFSTPAA